MTRLIFSSIALSLFAAATANAVPEPDITPAPVAPRQLFTDDGDSSGFIGYFSTDGGYAADYCPEGATFSMDDQYAGCCDVLDPDCQLATGCKGNTIFVAGTSTTCDIPSASCNTDYILVSSGDNKNLGWYWLGCATDAEHVFYQNYPGGTAASTTLPGPFETTHPAPAATLHHSSSPTPSNSPSHSASAAATGTNTEPNLLTGFPTAAATAAPVPSSPHKSSKAWIAAAVVVPLALLALAGALLFLCLRRRRNKPNPYKQESEFMGATSGPLSPAQQPYIPRSPEEQEAYGMGIVSPHPGYAHPAMASPQPSFMAPGAVSPMSEPLEPAPAYSESPAVRHGGGKGAHVYSYMAVPPGEREER